MRLHGPVQHRPRSSHRTETPPTNRNICEKDESGGGPRSLAAFAGGFTRSSRRTATRSQPLTPSQTLRPLTRTTAATRSGAAPGATFGGVQLRALGQWYPSAKGTVFGGGTDPKDNGIGAFGYRTGVGGRQGVAIPQRVMAALTGTNDKSVHQQYTVEVTNRDTGKRATFDIVDRGPGERVWREARRPVLDLTEGAVRQLGGTSSKNSAGQTVAASGIDNLTFRIIRR